MIIITGIKSAKNTFVKVVESEQTKRIAKTAFYVLIATEGPLAAFAVKAEKLVQMGHNLHRREWVLLAKNGFDLVIDCVSHPIFMIIRDGYQIGDYSIQFVKQARNLDPYALLTLTRIGITTLSIVSRVMPSPEIIVVTAVIKISLDIGQAFNAFIKGEIIEGIGFVAAAGVRGCNNQDHFRYVHRKWEVLTHSKYQKVWQRIQEGRDIDFLKGHPMEELRQAIEEGSEFYVIDQDGNRVNMGANFSDLGEGMVKDMLLTGRVHKLKDGEQIVVNFKLTKVFRERIQEVVNEYKDYDQAELAEFLHYAGVMGGMKITKDTYKMVMNGEWKEVYSSYKADNLHFSELGRVQLGADAHVHGLYKNVTAVVAGDADVQDLHMLLSLSGMGRAMRPSSTSDILRLQLGTLYRTFYPTKGIKLQRTEAFFDMPVEQLQQHIIKQEPGMAAVIENRLPEMKQVEVRKGWKQWTIPGRGDDVKKAGGAFLTHLVTGAKSSVNDMQDMDNVASMLESGMASTNNRFENGMKVTGWGSYNDMKTGGSNAVFTRLYTQNKLKLAKGYPFLAANQVQGTTICLSLDSIDRGSYQFPHNNYGSKGDNYAYATHDDAVTFAQKQNVYNTPYNEVMLNQCVPASEIRSIIVPTAEKKAYLIGVLDKKGLIEVRNGHQYLKSSQTDVNELIYTKNDTIKAFEHAAA